MLTTALAEGAVSGEFHLLDPMITALGISGLGMHIAHWFDPGQGYTRDQVAEAHVRLVLRMAGAAITADGDDHSR